MSHAVIFDIETNALELEEVKVIHTMTVYDYVDDEYYRYDLGKVSEGIKHIQRADVVIGHNIIDYDIPVIKKFYPEFSPGKIVDTLVWARLAYPDMLGVDLKLRKKGYEIPNNVLGRHSLEAWGYRLKENKGNFGKTTDWQEWSPEMSDYCEQDVRVNKKLYEKLYRKKISPEAIKLEHDVWKIIKRQIDNGFWFDKEGAEKLYAELIQKRTELEQKLKEIFGSWVEPDGPVKTSKVNNSKYGLVKGCKYQKIKIVEFNPNSRTHIYKRLMDKYGWKPKVFTDSGQPKVDEAVLKDLPYPEAELLCEYLMVNKRIGQIAEGSEAWLKWVGDDHRIHGYVNSNGTVTHRMAHSRPNVAQVPSSSSTYGPECRALWKPRPGWKMIGIDASGLELRCLAHYMAKYDGGKYAKVILEGDIHTENQHAAGLSTRDLAKRFIYAFIYGAGNETLGEIVVSDEEREQAIAKGGQSALKKLLQKRGKQIRSQFLKRTPALKELKERAEKVVKSRGYLIALDGRHIEVDSMYKTLNRLLQCAGAIVMKKALVIFDNDLQEAGLVPGKDYEFMANVHDEWQIEFNPKEEGRGELIGQIGTAAIRKAGEHFNFRCPLDGEYQIGNSWKETH